MSGPPELRASDDDRERVAREIREHYAAGRLDEDELNERLEAAYAARTAGELDALRAPISATLVVDELARRERGERPGRTETRAARAGGGRHRLH